MQPTEPRQPHDLNRRQLLALAAGAAVSASAAARAVHVNPLPDDAVEAYEFRRVRLPYPRNVGRNARLGNHGTGPTEDVVILKTRGGATGWGRTPGRGDHVLNAVDALVGKPLADVFDPSVGILHSRWSPLDIALHDLVGTMLGQPVWQMIGGRSEPLRPKAYSGMVYFDDLDPDDNPAGIEKVIQNATWDRDYGYRQLKVKVGRGARWMEREAGLQRDIDVMKALAEALPDCELLVDGNDGFTAESFIHFLEGIAPIPLFWIEEPFRETPADWRKLAGWCRGNGYADTYMADGEANPDFNVLREIEADGTLTLRLTDIDDYGLTRWRTLMPQLNEQNVAASPHTWGSALKTVHAAHFAAAGVGTVPTVECVTAVDSEVDFGDNRVADGSFEVSHKPGFGMKLLV